MTIKVDNKKYRVYYTVNVLYNKYKFDCFDSADSFIRYCVLGCTDIKDLSDINLKVHYEEVEINDRTTD